MQLGEVLLHVSFVKSIRAKVSAFEFTFYKEIRLTYNLKEILSLIEQGDYLIDVNRAS